MQRSETLRDDIDLPYRTCITSVRDRHFLGFLHGLAGDRFVIDNQQQRGGDDLSLETILTYV